MKLSSISIIFLIIIIPFIFISAQEAETSAQDLRLRYYYDNIVDNAVQDAAVVLSKNINVLNYGTNIDMSGAIPLAADAFFSTVHHSFNAYGNPTKMARVEACIPILIFLEKEGFTLYALSRFKNSDGFDEAKHCYYPMQQYVASPIQDRYIVRYTLGKEVYIYDIVDQTIEYGPYSDYSHVCSAFSHAKGFENLQLSAIKDSIKESLREYMNEYNSWSKGSGLQVKIEFPAIDDSDWARALQDEGIIVFAQGFPVLQGKKYEHYALGGGRVIRKEHPLDKF